MKWERPQRSHRSVGFVNKRLATADRRGVRFFFFSLLVVVVVAIDRPPRGVPIMANSFGWVSMMMTSSAPTPLSAARDRCTRFSLSPLRCGCCNNSHPINHIYWLLIPFSGIFLRFRHITATSGFFFRILWDFDKLILTILTMFQLHFFGDFQGFFEILRDSYFFL